MITQSVELRGKPGGAAAGLSLAYTVLLSFGKNVA